MSTQNQGAIPKLSLQCPRCKQQLTESDFATSIVQFGLIFLWGFNGCWFGCTCNNCKISTVIEKFPYNENCPTFLAELHSCITNDQKWAYSILSTSPDPENPKKVFYKEQVFHGTWFYNPFPYLYESNCTPLFRNSFEIPARQDKIYNILALTPDFNDASDAYHKAYCTFANSCYTLSPAMDLMWLYDEEIKKLAILESETIKKAFPRYFLYDETWDNIQKFCWTHKLQKGFESNLHDLTQIPVVNFFTISSKEKFQKSQAFMGILDQLPAFMLSDPENQAEIKRAQIAIRPVVPIDKTSIYYEARRVEQLTKLIWDNLYKDYIQNYLFDASEKFIDNFIEQSKSINFSYGSVWELKEQCLKELHGIIHSDYQRKKVQKERDNEIERQAKDAEKAFPGVNIISKSRKINELKIKISQLYKVVEKCNFKGPILILGENGTGKNHFAKAIHTALKLKGPFVKVDCGVKTETLFENELFGHKKGAFTGAIDNQKGALDTAAGGTVFLDEIGNIPVKIQQKLLGVIEDRLYSPVGSSETKQSDAFIIAATNADLMQMVEEKTFREDLFYRLNCEIITIPPLRERKGDIPLFFKHLKMNLPIDSNLEADLKRLKYDWPGNVRELIHTIDRIERNKIMEDDTTPICFDDLPEKIRGAQKVSEKSSMKVEKVIKGPGNTKITPEEVREALKRNDGNKTKAATELGVTYHTILRHCKKFGI